MIGVLEGFEATLAKALNRLASAQSEGAAKHPYEFGGTASRLSV